MIFVFFSDMCWGSSWSEFGSVLWKAYKLLSIGILVVIRRTCESNDTRAASVARVTPLHSGIFYESDWTLLSTWTLRMLKYHEIFPCKWFQSTFSSHVQHCLILIMTFDTFTIKRYLLFWSFFLSISFRFFSSHVYLK